MHGPFVTQGRHGEEFTFSPLFDHIAGPYGTITAAVYGVVYRHCQMRDGVCRASTRRMAQLVGMDEVTVLRHIHKLVDDGYLLDLTPERRNRPHIYQLVRSAYARPDSAPEDMDAGG